MKFISRIFYRDDSETQYKFEDNGKEILVPVSEVQSFIEKEKPAGIFIRDLSFNGMNLPKTIHFESFPKDEWI